MKIKLLNVLFVVLLCVIVGCNKKSVSLDNSNKNTAFEEVKIEESSFRKIGNKYKFGLKAEVKNISTYIFDDVYTTLEIEFELENGNFITKKEYESALSMATGFGDLEKIWKPNEIRSIGDKMLIESDFIPNGFKDYPIKKVNAVVQYSCTDLINKTKNDYFTTIDVTKEWNNAIGKSVENIQNKTNLSTETKENEPALIKDIFLKNGKTYISLDIVQIEYTKVNDYKVINQNSKIRNFEVSENVKIKDNNCRTIDENDYLIKNRERYISKKDDEICMFSSVDGIITEINFGCWN